MAATRSRIRSGDPVKTSPGAPPWSTDLLKDLLSDVLIEAEAGEVLEAKIAVAVDLRGAQPVAQVGRTGHVGPEEIGRGEVADGLHGFGDACVRRAFQAGVGDIEIDF